MKPIFATVLLAATALCAPAFAQTLPNGTAAAETIPALAPESPLNVVVTATRIPALAETIPAGVTVIDRTTIEQRGYTTLVDALSAVPGLRVVQAGGAGQQASVFIRGANSNHTLVLRDGVPVNDPSDPGGAFNFGSDSVDDIERIEIVRGPMSGVYGSGAIGGVINLITRRGEGGPHGSAEIAGGAPRAVQGRGNISGSEGIFDYSASIETQSTEGSDVTPRRETSVYTGERDGFRTELATVNLGITPVEGTRLSALVRARSSVFGYDDIGFDGPNRTGRDSSVFGRIGGTTTLFGVWDSSLFVSHLQSDRKFIELLDANDPNQTQSDSRYHGRRTDVQWNNTVHVADIGPLTANAVTFGYEHIADQAKVASNSDFGGFLFDQATDSHQDSDAGFVGAQGVLLRRLTVTAQLRGEDTTIAGSAVTYRVGGVLAVPEVESRLKASYGTAFRAPALFDRYGVDTGGFVGNPNLKPEHSQGFEAGFETDVALFGRPNWATFGATYFGNRIRDLIQVQFTPVDTSVNVARASIDGAELVLTVRPRDWLEADLTYTYTDAQDQSDHTRLLRRPQNAASFNVRATPLPGLTIAPELLYTGRFTDDITDDNGLSVGVGQARAGLLFNLNVTYAMLKNVDVFAWAKNIGGSRFEPANGFATPGPSFLAGTRVRF